MICCCIIFASLSVAGWRKKRIFALNSARRTSDRRDKETPGDTGDNGIQATHIYTTHVRNTKAQTSTAYLLIAFCYPRVTSTLLTALIITVGYVRYDLTEWEKRERDEDDEPQLGHPYTK